MKNLLFLLNLLFTIVLFGQNQANNWYFGQNAGINFSNGIPVALDDGVLNTPEGCSTISDSNGNLLFYTDGIDVWNKNHQLMPNGTGLLGSISSTQSGIIIPHPGNINLYYVFSLPETGGENGLRYSLVDMSLDSGLGDVVTSEKNVLLYESTSEKISAIKHTNENDIWVVSHASDSNKFVSYLVTNNGIQMNPVETQIGHTPVDIYDNVGAMKISPDGTKLAVAYSSEVLDLFEFNATTGKPSNNIQITDFDQGLPISYIYGVEFSSNSKYLYVSETQDGIIQFDTSNFNYNDIINSRYDLTTNGESFGDFPHSALQLGPDKKIYVAHFEYDYLGVINNPNAYGDQADYQYDGVYLTTGVSKAGLPPFIQSFFDSYIKFEGNCFGEFTEFEVSGNEIFDSVLWDFGDGTFSSQETVNHLYDAPGEYQVAITLVDGFNVIEQNQTITIYDVPVITSSSDIILCSDSFDDPLDFNFQNQSILNIESNGQFMTSYHNSFVEAELNLNPIELPFQSENIETTIYVRVFNKNNPDCFTVSQFQIIYLETPDFEFNENWYLCKNEEVTVSVPYGFDSILWSTGEVSNTITLNETGEYWVEVSNYYNDITCTEIKYFNVSNSDVAEITNITVDDWTSNSNSIIVEAEGIGNYEYSIDGIFFQDSNVFNDVKYGDYTVYVRDKNNCGVVSEDVFLIYYPSFFTPNNDGINDAWKIKSIASESSYTIDIFDRYGKFIKQLNPDDNSWDGTFNGLNLRSDDYWFILTRYDGRTYTGHFALKR